MTERLTFVDDYLEKWDQFAQGTNEVVPYIRDHRGEFEAALAELLKVKDRRAPARLVFYAVVQVGGFIPLDTDLGMAAIHILGDDFPVTEVKGQRQLFSGNLYYWWDDHKGKFDPLPLFEEWQSREFARETVLPMYEATRRRKP